MPRYEYKCDLCGHTEDQTRPIAKRDDKTFCPVCDPDFKALNPGVLLRDVVASFAGQASTDQEYDKPVYSSALGVPVYQIREAQKRFPHHEFAPDGRMVLRSHNQRKKVLRELGYHDRDSYV